MVKKYGFDRTIFSLVFAIVIFQLLDTALTLHGIVTLRQFGEANPIIRLMMARFGILEGLIMIKGAIILLTFLIYWISFRPIRRCNYVKIGLLLGVGFSSYPVGAWCVALATAR